MNPNFTMIKKLKSSIRHDHFGKNLFGKIDYNYTPLFVKVPNIVHADFDLKAQRIDVVGHEYLGGQLSLSYARHIPVEQVDELFGRHIEVHRPGYAVGGYRIDATEHVEELLVDVARFVAVEARVPVRPALHVPIVGVENGLALVCVEHARARRIAERAHAELGQERRSGAELEQVDEHRLEGHLELNVIAKDAVEFGNGAVDERIAVELKQPAVVVPREDGARAVVAGHVGEARAEVVATPEDAPRHRLVEDERLLIVATDGCVRSVVEVHEIRVAGVAWQQQQRIAVNVAGPRLVQQPFSNELHLTIISSKLGLHWQVKLIDLLIAENGRIVGKTFGHDGPVVLKVVAELVDVVVQALEGEAARFGHVGGERRGGQIVFAQRPRKIELRLGQFAHDPQRHAVV